MTDRTSRWTPEEDAKLIALRNAGRPLADCARIIGRSKHACRGRSQHLGIVKKQPQKNGAEKRAAANAAIRSSGILYHAAEKGAPPPAPRHAGADRAAERMARYIAGGMSRSAARNQVAMEFPGVLIREAVHA